MKGFKSIDNFTFAECQEFLRGNDKDPVLYDQVYARMERLLREQEELDDDIFMSCKTLEDYQKYNRNYPNGRHIRESKQITERLIWEKHSKSRKLCQSYITNYPNGTYIEEAKNILLMYQKEKKCKRIKRWCSFALGLVLSSLGVFVYPFKTICICRTLFGQYAGHLQNNVVGCLVVMLGLMIISAFLMLLAWFVQKINKENGKICKFARTFGLKSSFLFFLYGISIISVSFLTCSRLNLIGEYEAINSDEVEYRDSVFNSNGELIATPATSDSISYPDDWSTNGELDTKSMPLMYDNDKIKPNDIDKTSKRPLIENIKDKSM